MARHHIALIALASITLTFGGCYYNDDRSDVVREDPGLQVFEAPIDTAATLTQEPGVGAGVFIEYLGAGDWHVFTTCDTNLSGYDCRWDVFATVPDGVWIDDVRGGELEVDDQAFTRDGYTAQLTAFTDADYDRMYFHTEPGEPVRFEAYLDDIRDARYIYWIGDGAIHDGAPSNPIDLVPSSD